MKLNATQKTSTKLFDLQAEIVDNDYVFIKLTTEEDVIEHNLPLDEDTYWEFDNLWDEYIDFHCENCDDPTYWYSGKGDAKELNRFTRILYKMCGVKG